MRKLPTEIIEAYRLHPEFLGLDIKDANQRGALDSTLLHIAARTGNVEHIKVLVGAGADINARGDLESTPLHEAAMCGQAIAAELLLSLGANPQLKNELGQTANDMAVLGQKANVCEVLQRNRSSRRK